MTEPRRRGQGFWLTAGEVVGVLALVVAGLNYWDSHQQHTEEARRAQAQSVAETAFVAVGEADSGGRIVTLRPLKSAQAIQSQRYTFPVAVLDHPVDIAAARPRIERDWLADGVKRAIERAHARAPGSARLPVAIETVFVEDGDTRTDVSLYDLGVSWRRVFLGGLQVRLEGIALARRRLSGPVAPILDRRWSAEQARLAAKPAGAPAT